MSEKSSAKLNLEKMEKLLSAEGPLASIFSGFEINNTAGGLAEAQVVRESDLALVHSVYIQVLNFLVFIGWFAVANRQLIESCLRDIYINADGSTFLVEVRKTLA